MIPFIRGQVHRQAHVGIPDGFFEEEYGREGFYGAYAHIVRSQAPVNWERIEGPLRPRAFNFSNLLSSDLWEQRDKFLYNEDLSIDFMHLHGEMPYYFRNADGDELLFVHEGEGEVESDFGWLAYERGDYLVIPRGTVYRLTPKLKSSFLLIEAYSQFRVPDKGLLGQHALWDPAVVEVPEPRSTPVVPDGQEHELRIKRQGEITKVFYGFCPITTVGWKGTLALFKVNVRDIRPVHSERFHLPPSAHTSFLAQGFIVCSFLPRPLETGDPTALRVPFYHSNIDYDEVIFYHDGDFFSRTNIDRGMLTLHPQGIHHGPQPQARDRSSELERTDEVAVMVDTVRPLRVNGKVSEVELHDYWKSWQE